MSKLVTIFGGSGFVGRYIAQQLAMKGWRVRVAVRRVDDDDVHVGAAQRFDALVVVDADGSRDEETALGIEVGVRLVQHDQIGIIDQRLSQSDAASHPL